MDLSPYIRSKITQENTNPIRNIIFAKVHSFFSFLKKILFINLNAKFSPFTHKPFLPYT